MIQPLQAEALPSNDRASRDMNIIISAYTIAQIIAPVGCGLILNALVHKGAAAAAGGGGSASGSYGRCNGNPFDTGCYP